VVVEKFCNNNNKCCEFPRVRVSRFSRTLEKFRKMVLTTAFPKGAYTKGSYSITKEIWDIQKEDKPPKEGTNFIAPTIAKGDDDELKGANPNSLVPSQGLKNRETLKNQYAIPVASPYPSIK
jgi:hypothetical protein